MCSTEEEKLHQVQMLLRRMLLLWSILENMTEVENLILVKAKSMEVATVATDLVVS